MYLMYLMYSVYFIYLKLNSVNYKKRFVRPTTLINST